MNRTMQMLTAGLALALVAAVTPAFAGQDSMGPTMRQHFNEMKEHMQEVGKHLTAVKDTLESPDAKAHMAELERHHREMKEHVEDMEAINESAPRKLPVHRHKWP